MTPDEWTAAQQQCPRCRDPFGSTVACVSRPSVAPQDDELPFAVSQYPEPSDRPVRPRMEK